MAALIAAKQYEVKKKKIEDLEFSGGLGCLNMFRNTIKEKLPHLFTLSQLPYHYQFIMTTPIHYSIIIMLFFFFSKSMIEVNWLLTVDAYLLFVHQRINAMYWCLFTSIINFDNILGISIHFFFFLTCAGFNEHLSLSDVWSILSFACYNKKYKQ